MKNKLWKLYLLALAILCSCNDPYEGSTYQIYSVNPISTYLENRSDDFSEWVKVLKYADLFNAVNQATEAFTVCAPDNQAFKKFYESKKVTSIEELGQEYARSLAQYHILADSIGLETFILGGKLEVKTLSDDDLTVTFSEDSEEGGGFNSVYVNREARVTELATKASNGYIYVLDSVLSPLVETVYDRIKDKGDLYSIFKEACDKTSWSDSLNVIYDDLLQPNGSCLKQKRNYTLLAVTDDAFKNSNIFSFNDLVERIEATSDYTNIENELFRYIAYHIIGGNYSLFELKKFDTGKNKIWGTLANEAIINISLESDGHYYLNYGSEELKAMFIEDKSDVYSRNGVVHQIDSYLPIWEAEEPVPVYFDFCNNSAIASYIASNGTTGQIYQTAHTSTEYRTDISKLSCFEVDLSSSGKSPANFNVVDYFTVKSTGSNWVNCMYYDQLILNLGYLGSISMKTPVIIKGKYKVTIRVAYATSMNFMRIMSNGSNGGAMKFTFDQDETKSITAAPYTSVPSSTLNVYDYVLFEELDFSKTGIHDFKIVVTDPVASTNSSFRIQLDYLLFEPIN